MKQWPEPAEDNKSEAVEILKAIKTKNDKYRKFLQRLALGKPYTQGCYDSNRENRSSLTGAPSNSRRDSTNASSPIKRLSVALKSVKTIRRLRLMEEIDKTRKRTKSTKKKRFTRKTEA